MFLKRAEVTIETNDPDKIRKLKNQGYYNMYEQLAGPTIPPLVEKAEKKNVEKLEEELQEIKKANRILKAKETRRKNRLKSTNATKGKKSTS
jgi:hypothetical protein